MFDINDSYMQFTQNSNKIEMMSVPNRPFSSGSRKAPDPYDQFLEREGYYRKHTARDSSCLFRVVSEQLFDIQKYHLKVREDCVYHMRKNKDKYEKVIEII